VGLLEEFQRISLVADQHLTRSESAAVSRGDQEEPARIVVVVILGEGDLGDCDRLIDAHVALVGHVVRNDGSHVRLGFALTLLGDLDLEVGRRGRSGPARSTALATVVAGEVVDLDLAEGLAEAVDLVAVTAQHLLGDPLGGVGEADLLEGDCGCCGIHRLTPDTEKDTRIQKTRNNYFSIITGKVNIWLWFETLSNVCIIRA